MPLATSLVAEIDELHRRISSDHVDLFRALADLDRAHAWKDSGARDCASWVSIRYGISEWKARRWLSAAHALETLAAVRDALASGRLGVDKVVELAPFRGVRHRGRPDRVGRSGLGRGGPPSRRSRD